MKLFKKPDIFLCEITELKTFVEKTKGLLGILEPSGAYFRTRGGVHTFGMKFPIDVLVTDENLCIRSMRRGMSAGRFYFWNPRFANVFEIPAGIIDSASLKEGDELELHSS